jgi:hypothetical protein
LAAANATAHCSARSPASTWTLLAGGGVSVLKALQAAAASLSNLAMRQDAQGPVLAGREKALPSLLPSAICGYFYARDQKSQNFD